MCLIMGIYSQLWQFHTGNDALGSLIFGMTANRIWPVELEIVKSVSHNLLTLRIWPGNARNPIS